jgi:hypothetical protein
VDLRASSASSTVGSHLWVSDRIYSTRRCWVQLRSGGEKEEDPVSRRREGGELPYSGVEVVYCEPELKEQDPKKSKSLPRRGLAG